MKVIEQISKLQRIDQLIRLESTGNPTEFANKLNISVSTLFELLNCLKQLGADIYYNRDKLSYKYKVPTKLVFKLEKQELGKIYGGKITHSRKIGISFIKIAYCN